MYRFIRKTDPSGNVSREYIESLEKKWNIRFPEILVNYYLNFNMSENEECIFTIDLLKGEGSEFELDCLIPLRYGTVPLEKEYESVRNNEEIPDVFIPLAYDMDGDLYYWHKHTQAVWYISHENAEHPIPVCESVEAYFALLEKSCGAGR